jgi:RNA recognition motif-containing protein
MYGKVNKVTIDVRVPDRDSFGFCFVEMPFEGQALRAIRELEGKMLNGKSLIVKESGVSA